MLLKALLTIAHILIYFKTFIWGLITSFSKPLSVYFRKHSWSQIQADCRELKKLPIHIGLVIVEDNISIADVANIVLWCTAMSISYVSIYDRLGTCKVQKERLQGEIQKRQKSVLGEKCASYNVSLQSGFCEKLLQNDECSSTEAKVVLLDRSDGTPALVAAARTIASAVASKQTVLEDITPDSVDAMLKVRQPMPDPDLVLRFGSTQSMLGYLPWQIRLTEILSLPSHHSFDYISLHKAISSYGNTEQRFGK